MEDTSFQMVSDAQQDSSSRPRLGVKLIHLISEEGTLQTTWDRR